MIETLDGHIHSELFDIAQKKEKQDILTIGRSYQ